MSGGVEMVVESFSFFCFFLKKGKVVKKIISLIIGIISLLFIPASYSDSTKLNEKKSTCSFRNTSWGMSRAQVKVAERIKTIAHESDTVVGYVDAIRNIDVLVAYKLTKDILTSGMYLVVEKHPYDNDFIWDYNTLQDLLRQKYGPPKKDKIVWRNDQYRDNPSRYGMAIRVGHLRYFSEWETSDTLINLLLEEMDQEITLSLKYSSRKYRELEKNDQIKKDFKQL